jgi:hypothetical protein
MLLIPCSCNVRDRLTCQSVWWKELLGGRGTAITTVRWCLWLACRAHDRHVVFQFEHGTSVRLYPNMLHSVRLVESQGAWQAVDTNVVRKLVCWDERDKDSIGARDEVHNVWLAWAVSREDECLGIHGSCQVLHRMSFTNAV